MAEGGKNGEGGGGGTHLQEPPTHSPVSASTLGTKRHVPRGIVIQLTGTEGEWDSLDDSELIFSLDHDEDYPSISLSKERQFSVEDEGALHTQAFHVPLSPSSPGSLGNCSTTSPSFLSPGPSSSPSHRPLASLVKSLSSELELKESSTLRPKPLLNLVKSISTEISRSEPEVSQSKSDSRLNLHLWKQLTQAKTRSNGDSRTAPPSPSSLSPSAEGLKGGFFKMELEDTKRKLSEAVHEPFSSMFSKIMREESTGSPKHQWKNQGGHQSGHQGGHQVSSRGLGQEGSPDMGGLESPGRNIRRTDAEVLPVFDWPSIRHPGRHHRSVCPVHHYPQYHRDEELEIFTDGDVMQILTTERKIQPAGPQLPAELPVRISPLPRMTLFCVAVLSYGYFILPLSPYFSGLALGLALGFLLGLLLIRMGSSRSPDPRNRKTQRLLGEGILTGGTACADSDTLKGWMNEIHDYDPETYHPALTHSVFATLEGSCLRLDTPRNNISRRATYGERVHETSFVKTRHFQLTKSKVFLLPSVLAQKRVWNPKYPICIQLARRVNSSEEEEEKEMDEEEKEEEGHIEKPEVELSGFSKVSRDHPLSTTLYLFGRTGREKEEWFRHFLFASVDAQREKERDKQRPGRCVSRSGDPSQLQNLITQCNVPSSRGSSRVGSSDDDVPSTPPAPLMASVNVSQAYSTARGLSVQDYTHYMARLLTMEELTPLSIPGASSAEASPTIKVNCTCDPAEQPGKGQAAWANALIGRIFWDFLREKHWADMVSHKIQKKLSKIRLPYFMNELTVTEMDMGCSMPLITGTSRPEINPRGLWLELQMVYTGALQMTLQTKFNLSKLGKEGGQDTDCTTDTSSSRPVLSVLADSDEESSSAGSSDEEEFLPSEPQGPVGDKGSVSVNEGTVGGGKTGRKILKFVDKIAKSKYFQKATENEFIKKKFEEMSNTPLLLTVEVQELSGTLVINIPPPPTDRIWYSFCSPPKLDLHVRPKLGEREVTFCHVTEWIEKKLQDEFQKVFVLPNMDDIYLPLMHSGLESPQASHRQSQSSSKESIERIPPEISGEDSD
ncbi:testis-expressed protein 2 isoform X2 [Sphaeramia orbicularis]|uniref:testis-expressed protein 2 isoform X2 n=1 Tax=Sphaeramia orbicularis TaxID=375764 RepID=UPI00117C5B71|nr:testis-expressed protein 2-like isoform X2 [Sphaeramia orbicularis]